MERRLHHPALRAPRVAFVRHEAVAEQDRHAIDADALREIGASVNEDVAHVIRMRQDPEMALQDRRVDAKRVAMQGEVAFQDGQRVRLEADVDRL
jgi:hypothetical protein